MAKSTTSTRNKWVYLDYVIDKSKLILIISSIFKPTVNLSLKPTITTIDHLQSHQTIWLSGTKLWRFLFQVPRKVNAQSACIHQKLLRWLAVDIFSVIHVCCTTSAYPIRLGVSAQFATKVFIFRIWKAPHRSKIIVLIKSAISLTWSWWQEKKGRFMSQKRMRFVIHAIRSSQMSLMSKIISLIQS